MDTVMDTRLVTRMDTRMVTVSIRSIHTRRTPTHRKGWNFCDPTAPIRPRLGYVCWLFDLLSRRSGHACRRRVSDGRFDDAALVPRARRPKGRRALVRVRGDASHGQRRAEKISGGDDHGRAAPGPRSTADRLRVRVVPRCHAPAPITNTLAGYRTAELSDSPRASVMPPVPAFDRAEKICPRCCSIARNRNSIAWWCSAEPSAAMNR